MEQEPRKATDVLLDLESKVNVLLDLVRAQDLVIKVLSNKLNDVIESLKKQQAGPPRIVVETVQSPPKPSNIPPAFTQIPAGDPERVIPVTAESALPQTNTPHGFRRNSRPETYVSNPSQPVADELKMPIQIPQQANSNRQNTAVPPPGRGNGSEVVVPSANPISRKGNVLPPPNPSGSPLSQQSVSDTSDSPLVTGQGQIPVIRRCVDKKGKSIFLADVEIVDLETSQPVFKTRTNGTGKWSAALGIGRYRVTVRKRESVTKEKIEAVQDIQVDGSHSKLELPMLIIK